MNYKEEVLKVYSDARSEYYFWNGCGSNYYCIIANKRSISPAEINVDKCWERAYNRICNKMIDILKGENW